MYYLGIDPGFASGAYTIKSNDRPGGRVICCNDFIFIKNGNRKEINFRELYLSLAPYRHRIIMTVIEQQAGRPNQSSPTVFKTGGGYYGMIGVLQILRIPFMIVTAPKWKSFYNISKDKKESMKLAGQLYPHLDFSKVSKDDHRAESLLLARYGMYMHGELKK